MMRFRCVTLNPRVVSAAASPAATSSVATLSCVRTGCRWLFSVVIIMIHFSVSLKRYRFATNAALCSQLVGSKGAQSCKPFVCERVNRSVLTASNDILIATNVCHNNRTGDCKPNGYE